MKSPSSPVTQQFNTTSSMGRLTLNVLLSFAQFEREVTSERIRDKIAASKRKGIWVGGVVPLGYEPRDRKLVVIEEEAERVRLIFRRYLELGSLNLLLADLRQRGIFTKIRQLSAGKDRGGIPFTRGPLAYLLHNRFYIGEVKYKGEICPGEQPAILDRELFEAVQAKLAEQRNGHAESRSRSEALLQGRIVDDRHNRMTPTSATKRGIRYRYYVSAVLGQGQPELAGLIRRVPAAEIESLVLQMLRKHTGASSDAEDRSLIAAHVERVQLRPDAIVVTMRRTDADDDEFESNDNRTAATEGRSHSRSSTIVIPWRKADGRRGREIILPEGAADRRPARTETREKLLASIANGRRWLAEITTGSITIEDLAGRERCSIRRITMMLSLAFLAPALVRATADGRLPRGIGVSRLFDAPSEWSEQYAMLGLPT